MGGRALWPTTASLSATLASLPSRARARAPDASVVRCGSALVTRRQLRRCRCLTYGRFCMQKKLVLETTAPFQGLAELVAYDEGLFAKEGLTIEWADRDRDVDKVAQLHITSHKGVTPFSSHGKLLEQGKADLYNACEWGNYSRVGDTRIGSRQIGRRSIVT